MVGGGLWWWSVEGAFSCLGHVFAKSLAAACDKIDGGHVSESKASPELRFSNPSHFVQRYSIFWPWKLSEQSCRLNTSKQLFFLARAPSLHLHIRSPPTQPPIQQKIEPSPLGLKHPSFGTPNTIDTASQPSSTASPSSKLVTVHRHLHSNPPAKLIYRPTFFHQL